MITTDKAAPKGNSSIKRKIMTSTVSFRLDFSLKEGLLGLAEKQGRSLSSLIQQSLQDLLDSYERGSGPVRLAQEEKRQHLRKEILLPARWRIRKGSLSEPMSLLSPLKRTRRSIFLRFPMREDFSASMK